MKRQCVKTIHFTNSWHPNAGGISTFYRELFRAAERAGTLMRLVVPGPETRIEKVGETGLVYHVKSRPAPLNPQYRLLWPGRFLIPGSIVQRIVNSEQPDLIEVSEKYTLP